MSATSGIPIHSALRQQFAQSTHRFIKLAIRDEVIVLDNTAPIQGDLGADLDALQLLLEDDVPAYVLARLDDPPAQWLIITYVPDAAKVRDKMLYASTRNALTKSLGSASFSDALFATHKSDLTSAAYAAHRRHQAAPKPLSAREQEMAGVQAAERAAGVLGNEGNAARKNHLGGAGVQMKWRDDVEEAVKALVEGEENRLVVVDIDPATETLALVSNNDCTPNDVGSSLPPSDPSYAFFAWSFAQRREIIFVYSCPSTSPIKQRMIFSSSVSSVLTGAKDLGAPITKKIETSDPREINETFLRAEVDLLGSRTEEKRPFAKPRGPARKQR